MPVFSLVLSLCRVHGRERPVWSCGVVDWFGRPPNEQPVAWSDSWSQGCLPSARGMRSVANNVTTKANYSVFESASQDFQFGPVNHARTFRAIHASEHHTRSGDPLIKPADVNLGPSAR